MANDEDVQKKSCSQKCNDFMKFLWNSERKEFLGRNGLSWAKIGVFYLIFYSCLAGFFAVMLVGFFSTVDDTEPTQQGLYSLLKSNPGMGFRPVTSVFSTLISFKTSDPDTYTDYVENLKELLETYKTEPDNAIDCTTTNKPSKEDKTVCNFKLDLLGLNCTEANSFGYATGNPCIALKVNKIFGWQPEPFSNASTADEENEHDKEGKELLKDRLDPDYIGITCDGENEGDADNIFSVDYNPRKGFSYNYFPYYNHPNYMQPLVFVQFNVRKGVLIQIWCKLWAKNIKHHKNDKAGSAHFELLVDK
jgi:sodium/potassium-transporting ATPase subunit beta